MKKNEKKILDWLVSGDRFSSGMPGFSPAYRGDLSKSSFYSGIGLFNENNLNLLLNKLKGSES